MTALYTTVALAGVGWLLTGVVVYIVYRRRQGLDFVTTKRVAIPKPVVDHEAEYESVLVVFDESSFSPTVLATAQRLAARRRRGIHVLVLITVPSSSPLAARLPEAEAAAESTIEQARLQGGRRVSGHWEKVRAGQGGRRIVDEARVLQARAVVMPLPRRGSASLFGKTLETVLGERPCRVIIESEPGAGDGRADGARPPVAVGART